MPPIEKRYETLPAVNKKRLLRPKKRTVVTGDIRVKSHDACGKSILHEIQALIMAKEAKTS
jgi:hypothetical protein